MKEIQISNIVDYFQLEVCAGSVGLPGSMNTEEIHRPGLELTGHLNLFPKDRIHILGKQESDYLGTLDDALRSRNIQDYIQMKPPCLIISSDLPIYAYFVEACNIHGVPLLKTKERTSNFMSKLHRFLERSLAPEIGIHGVCINVYGVGILIRGESGIGKSEIALALISRGHRLISDDLVMMKRIGPEALIATNADTNKHFLSLRGVGLINVLMIYGSGAFQQETRINMDILLSHWDPSKTYDAMGMENNTVNYMGVDVESHEIPIRPGRDIASLIEVSAKNWRLRQANYSALDDFLNRIAMKQNNEPQ